MTVDKSKFPFISNVDQNISISNDAFCEIKRHIPKGIDTTKFELVGIEDFKFVLDNGKEHTESELNIPKHLISVISKSFLVDMTIDLNNNADLIMVPYVEKFDHSRNPVRLDLISEFYKSTATAILNIELAFIVEYMVTAGDERSYHEELYNVKFEAYPEHLIYDPIDKTDQFTLNYSLHKLEDAELIHNIVDGVVEYDKTAKPTVDRSQDTIILELPYEETLAMGTDQMLDTMKQNLSYIGEVKSIEGTDCVECLANINKVHSIKDAENMKDMYHKRQLFLDHIEFTIDHIVFLETYNMVITLTPDRVLPLIDLNLFESVDSLIMLANNPNYYFILSINLASKDTDKYGIRNTRLLKTHVTSMAYCSGKEHDTIQIVAEPISLI